MHICQKTLENIIHSAITPEICQKRHIQLWWSLETQILPLIVICKYQRNFLLMFWCLWVISFRRSAQSYQRDVYSWDYGKNAQKNTQLSALLSQHVSARPYTVKTTTDDDVVKHLVWCLLQQNIYRSICLERPANTVFIRVCNILTGSHQ